MTWLWQGGGPMFIAFVCYLQIVGQVCTLEEGCMPQYRLTEKAEYARTEDWMLPDTLPNPVKGEVLFVDVQGINEAGQRSGP